MSFSNKETIGSTVQRVVAVHQAVQQNRMLYYAIQYGTTFVISFATIWTIRDAIGISSNKLVAILAGGISFLLTILTLSVDVRLLERRIRDQEATAKRGHFQILNAIPMPIIVCSPPQGEEPPDGAEDFARNIVIFANKAWCNHFNKVLESVLGKPISEIRDCKQEILVYPRGSDPDTEYKKLVSDWNECFVKLNNGHHRVVSNVDMRMRIPGGSQGRYRFIYSAEAPDALLNSIVILTQRVDKPL